MNTFIKSALTGVALMASVSNVCAAVDMKEPTAKYDVDQSVIDNSVSRKFSPEVTLDIVQEKILPILFKIAVYL